MMTREQGGKKDWRELCAAAATEPDPEKLSSLIRQILVAFDHQEQIEGLKTNSRSSCTQA
jgi:hypothetical protein